MIFRPKHTWIAGISAVGILVGIYILKANPAGYDTTPEVSSTPLADNTVVLVEPAPGSRVVSPLKVRGRARGSWFFEASFPVTLKNKDGVIIAQSFVQAIGEWMTTEFVDFEGTLTFTQPPQGQSGTLILHKDNPSGLPEHDDSREVIIYFQ